MRAYCLLLPIVLPILAGLGLLLWNPSERQRRRFCMTVVLLNVVALLCVILLARQESLALLPWNEQLRLLLAPDGFGLLFACLVALLWVPTTQYAFSYMAHERGALNGFFSFFLICLGLVEGIALAGNFLTLYTCYELLSFASLPLVMFGMREPAKRAGRQYLLYAMLGAAMVFTAWILLLGFDVQLDFRYGGVLAGRGGEANGTLLLAFLLAFFGFGVKAAIFPFHAWLPAASVAPTPVTALLHAVAVVKSGVFCVGRVIYYLIGPQEIAGSRAQSVAIGAASLSIVVATLFALRCTHLKRRLAYSTMANLSYILLAFALCSADGFLAGSLHLLLHAFAKITLFFVAGSVLLQSGQQEIVQLRGMARQMPKAFFCFFVCALSLCGIPPLAGFSGKWLLLCASWLTAGSVAKLACLALVFSAFACAIYLGAVLLYAYTDAADALGEAKDPDWRMCVPMLALTGIVLLFSVLLPTLLAPLRLLLSC